MSNTNFVKTSITDSNGCLVESSEIMMTIHPKPVPIGIFYLD